MINILFLLIARVLAADPCPTTLPEAHQFFVKNGLIEQGSDLKQLTSLNLSEVQYSEEDLRYLCHATELEALDLYNDSKPQDQQLKGEGLLYLESLKKLKYLDLDGNQLKAESLKSLKSDSIETLKLYSNPLAKGEQGLRGLNSLLQLTNLKTLVLQASQDLWFTSEDFEKATELHRHPTLKSLYLSGNDFSAGLSMLANYQGLEFLNLSGVRIHSKTSLDFLLSLKSLKSLSLSNENVVEEQFNHLGAGQLSKLKNLKLETLNLSGLDLQQVVLDEIKDLEITNLQMINVSIEPEQYIQLAKNSPGVRCIHVHSIYVDHYTEFLAQAAQAGVGNRFAVQGLFGSTGCR